MTNANQPEHSIREVTDSLARVLAEAGILDAHVDAELLVAHVLGISRGELAARQALDRTLSEDDSNRVRELGHRRAQREPLQHITGHAYFRHLDLVVGPGVFVPRPETELLAQMVIDHVRALPDSRPRVIDLGTGSGALAFSIASEVPHADVIAIEKSDDAIVWTMRNRDRLGLNNVRVIHGDLGESVAEFGHSFSVVVSNPPYIPNDMVPRDEEVRLFDPAMALYGGEDGLDVIRAISVVAQDLVVSGGLLALEHGELQGEAIARILRQAGWRAIATHKDLLGRDRYTTALAEGLEENSFPTASP